MEKQMWKETEKRREEKRREEQRREEKIREEKKVRGKKMQVREKGFPMICGSGGSKSRLAKAAGAEPSGQMRDENCTPLWGEAHVQVRTCKAHHSRSTFGSWDDEKVRAGVARSTCRSQNVQSTTLGAPWEVEMMKKCKPLWRQAHVEVKTCKAHHSRCFFGSWDDEKVHAIVARSTCPSQNEQNNPRPNKRGSLSSLILYRKLPVR